MRRPSADCTVTREAMAELALGIADGEQRALVLEHAAGCSDCRRELQQLSSLGDDLIALAPHREPPAGFESRVLDRIGVRHTKRRRPPCRLRRLALAAAVPAAAAATALAMSVSYSSDRQLAAQYRAALRGAHGTYFQSAGLHAPAGQVTGIVFAYEGSPSWLFYVLDGRHSSDQYEEEIITRSGRAITLPPFRVVNQTWGISTPVPVRDIARVKLIPQPRGAALEATLPVVEK